MTTTDASAVAAVLNDDRPPRDQFRRVVGEIVEPAHAASSRATALPLAPLHQRARAIRDCDAVRRR